ncbi:MAG TPA: hypothetical protein VJ997_04970 [Longimicrobiales bacterium]|nr:hypothetical protein [Longimicrobiales bacterium]
MTPKKTILRELSRAHDPAKSPTHIRPSTITGFTAEPERFQKAVNELLKDRLIEGKRDDEGHMAIALNAGRMDDVRRHLRPAWTHPAVIAVVILLGAAGAAGLML